MTPEEEAGYALDNGLGRQGLSMGAQMAYDRLRAELGTEPSVVGVARLYAPWASTLVIDANGNIYGTASEGGASNNGTVFKITQ